KVPAAKLRAVGEIGILGERIVLPASGVVYSFPAPNSRSSIEIEEAAAACTRAMLDDEMAVEQDAFDFGKRRVIAVEISPARLHHGQLGIAEVRQGKAQKIGAGLEIGVENGDQFAYGGV